jgi:hypothetical protein
VNDQRGDDGPRRRAGDRARPGQGDCALSRGHRVDDDPRPPQGDPAAASRAPRDLDGDLRSGRPNLDRRLRRPAAEQQRGLLVAAGVNCRRRRDPHRRLHAQHEPRRSVQHDGSLADVPRHLLDESQLRQCRRRTGLKLEVRDVDGDVRARGAGQRKRDHNSHHSENGENGATRHYDSLGWAASSGRDRHKSGTILQGRP